MNGILSIDVGKLCGRKYLRELGQNKKLFLKLKLVEKKNDYGDDGFLAIFVPKDDPDWEEKLPIVGNVRYFKEETAPPKPQQPTQPAPKATEFGKDDEIPF